MEVPKKKGLTNPDNSVAIPENADPIKATQQTSSFTSHAVAPFRVLLLSADTKQCAAFSKRFAKALVVERFDSSEELLQVLAAGHVTDAIIANTEGDGWALLEKIRSNGKLAQMPVIMLTKELSPEFIEQARAGRADDIFDEDFAEGDFILRLQFLLRRKWYATGPVVPRKSLHQAKTPLWKRASDLLLISVALLLLSPVFLLVALAIMLDSKGPVFYKSKRAGSGFRVFDLYKFRTMQTDADRLVKSMASQNMYNQVPPVFAADEGTPDLCPSCRAMNLTTCQQKLFFDGKAVCERAFMDQKNKKVAFVKFQNDPRITRIGQFLRNTSLDELPQLVNILRGDMSLVGNRPLPIYEAEQLTTDEKIARFAGPAGLTGYWQVMKRGKGEATLSEQERIEMDIYYARNYSFWLDFKIMLKTFPALLQSTNV